MNTALSRPERPPLPLVEVRVAGPGDAGAVHRLSRPFVREGSLRERTLDELARRAADFLVVEAGAEGLV
ncbi:GNAT family N-acetyltransferase, partial [Streptomyces sp. NPDC055051]